MRINNHFEPEVSAAIERLLRRTLVRSGILFGNKTANRLPQIKNCIH